MYISPFILRLHRLQISLSFMMRWNRFLGIDKGICGRSVVSGSGVSVFISSSFGFPGLESGVSVVISFSFGPPRLNYASCL